jgi:hypothetical protein
VVKFSFRCVSALEDIDAVILPPAGQKVRQILPARAHLFVVAVMGYRSLTGFLPQSGPESETEPALLPAAVAAKSVMVYP